MHQRVQVARVRRRVVEPVGREVGVAEAAQVGDDHLEAGGGERGDVALPDALRLRPAVHQEQRDAAAALAPVGEVEQAPDPCALEPHRRQPSVAPFGMTTMPPSLTVKRRRSSSRSYPIVIPGGITTPLSTMARRTRAWRPTSTSSKRIDSLDRGEAVHAHARAEDRAVDVAAADDAALGHHRVGRDADAVLLAIGEHELGGRRSGSSAE